jgi:hypothetical protein
MGLHTWKQNSRNMNINCNWEKVQSLKEEKERSKHERIKKKMQWKNIDLLLQKIIWINIHRN